MLPLTTYVAPSSCANAPSSFVRVRASVTEARDNTVTDGSAARLEIKLSAMPAATKSRAGSPLTFTSGNTATTGGADGSIAGRVKRPSSQAPKPASAASMTTAASEVQNLDGFWRASGPVLGAP